MKRHEKLKVLKGVQKGSITLEDLREKSFQRIVGCHGYHNIFLIDGVPVNYETYIDKEAGGDDGIKIIVKIVKDEDLPKATDLHRIKTWLKRINEGREKTLFMCEILKSLPKNYRLDMFVKGAVSAVEPADPGELLKIIDVFLGMHSDLGRKVFTQLLKDKIGESVSDKSSSMKKSWDLSQLTRPTD